MSDDLIRRLQRANEYEPLGHDGWEAATALAEAQAEIARLEAALREIIDASNNTGIEMGTVGMRVAERVEDIARAALTDKPDAWAKGLKTPE